MLKRPKTLGEGYYVIKNANEIFGHKLLKSIKPAGVSSFIAEVNNEYCIKTLVGYDLLYNDGDMNDITTIENRRRDDLEHMLERLSQVSDLDVLMIT